MDESGWEFQITDECACPDNQFWFENKKGKGACVFYYNYIVVLVIENKKGKGACVFYYNIQN
jgi:hypothetical protein